MLYQQIRPETLDEVIGNTSTIGALRKLMQRPPEKRTHDIILHGPTGCGKTTLALIMAEMLGCAEDDMGLVLLNAANTKGIDTARAIEAEIATQGFGGSPRVYIIDESQQLLKDTQEALLHATEFTPLYCYFIWCTTAPEKLIPAIHSRATKYEVSKLSRRDMAKVLEAGVKALGHAVDPDILEAIPLVCEGIPRQALVLLEQVADMDDVDAALDILEAGSVHDKSVLDLMKLMNMTPELRQKKRVQILTTYNKIDTENSERIRRSLQTYLYNKLVKETRDDKAVDLVHLLTLFNENTYYGGKAQLGTIIARACIETPPVN